VDKHDEEWWVACLCAGWCGACRVWQPVFEEQAAAHPGLKFAWIDIEDEADAMGDIDIETFPTILVGRGENLLFLGPIQPFGAQLARLVASLRDQPAAKASADPQAQALFTRLKREVLARDRAC
jgi:thiol-disulfide isomerase/thioredoxin